MSSVQSRAEQSAVSSEQYCKQCCVQWAVLWVVLCAVSSEQWPGKSQDPNQCNNQEAVQKTFPQNIINCILRTLHHCTALGSMYCIIALYWALCTASLYCTGLHVLHHCTSPPHCTVMHHCSVAHCTLLQVSLGLVALDNQQNRWSRGCSTKAL